MVVHVDRLYRHHEIPEELRDMLSVVVPLEMVGQELDGEGASNQVPVAETGLGHSTAAKTGLSQPKKSGAPVTKEKRRNKRLSDRKKAKRAD
jgi:hypothetical protein